MDLPPIDVPDEQMRAAARARQATLTKPTGALGRLEGLSVWAAGVQHRCPPTPFTRIRTVVFAGDHGVADRGVSAYPSEVTRQMLQNFVAGGAAVNVLAAQCGATVRVVDVSVRGTGEAGRIRDGSGSIDVEDAMSEAETEAALALGRRIADEEVDGGADLLVAGDMGIGNTTVAATLIAALSGAEPVVVTGRGTGIEDAGWMIKTAVVRDALRRLRRKVAAEGGGPASPLQVLQTLGGPDLAATAGFLAQAAVRRTPILLDGVVICAAALAAERLAPGARRWWVPATRSPEPAQAMALDTLDLGEPLLDLDLRLGEGTGALLAVPILQAAVATLADMATFESAGVSGRTP
jgi:nicotinate-nucleotide--dimethylbenzimidazole phosphoribosyltransferase